MIPKTHMDSLLCNVLSDIGNLNSNGHHEFDKFMEKLVSDMREFVKEYCKESDPDNLSELDPVECFTICDDNSSVTDNEDHEDPEDSDDLLRERVDQYLDQLEIY
jgi:hypothetical protein